MADLTRKEFIILNAQTPAHLQLNLKGVNFTGIDLSGLYISNIDFNGCDFTGANMENTTISTCRFDRADFKNVSIAGSNINDCRFFDSNFKEATTGDAFTINCTYQSESAEAFISIEGGIAPLFCFYTYLMPFWCKLWCK